MASKPLGGESSPVTPLRLSVPDMPVLARILARFEREELEGFIAVAIDLLDVAAGDDDIEEDDSDCGVEDGPRGFDPEEDRCLAGDDGCGPVCTHGSVYWGSDREDGDVEGWLQPANISPIH